VRTCRQRRWWWRRVGEARGRRTPTPSPRRERMPFRRLPSAASGGGGHHAIEAAGDGAAAIPSRGSGRGGERVIGVEKNGGGPAPRIYFSLYNLSLSLFFQDAVSATCTRTLRSDASYNSPFLCRTDGVLLKPWFHFKIHRQLKYVGRKQNLAWSCVCIFVHRKRQRFVVD
jgi:hypothetical protein